MYQKNIKHYFDWAATSPADEDILRSSLETTLAVWGNASSIHTTGKEARGLLESVRKRCADVLEVSSDKLFFTSGGTESDHIPLLSVLNRPQKGTVLISSLEHPAIRNEAEELKKCGWKVAIIPSNEAGIITADAVISKLTDDTVLVCVMAVNNETGAIQPVYEIADALTHAAKGKRRAKLHVDSVQAAGKIPLDLSYAGIDSAAFSAHKICGPRGAGLLYLSDPVEPFLRGGGQEKNIRSGTENIYGALAFSKCLERYYINKKNIQAAERAIQQQKYTHDFLKKLSEIKGCSVIPSVRLEISCENEYSPWVVQVSFNNIPGQVMLRALDAEGFCISTGSACSSRKNDRPVLKAMNVDTSIRENAVRFSFGPHTTEEAMNELVEKTAEIAGRFNR
ncbi:MAG: cysteine desulfurase [Treponema sp.]|nr:cysteine desulfurase [Treponema sp.]